VNSNLEKTQKIEIENYLQRYIGNSASNKTIKNIELFLNKLYFISQAQCELDASILVCNIKPKILLKKIIIHNLPAALLESELLRKLPVQQGQLINLDAQSRDDLMQVTRTRIKAYLRKAGLYGADISISYKENNILSIDYIITIHGGTFALVNNVSVKGKMPFSTKYVQRHYQRMCLSFNRFLDALAQFSFRCYSRELEYEASEDLQERLAALGYVRASIRVEHEWLDPHDNATPPGCRKKDPNDKQPRCVNLLIDIDQGPHVKWDINIYDGKSTDRPAFLRFLGSMLATENFSRASLSYHDERAADHMIIKQELEKEINFIEAKNIDEQELTISAQNITKYLRSKGFANAEVVASYTQEDNNNIIVNFDIFLGEVYYIRSIEINPDKYKKYINLNELNSALRARSFFSSGALNYDYIEQIKTEIGEKLTNKGFEAIEVKADLVSSLDNGIDLSFYINSQPRNIINIIEIKNGYDELNNKVIATLHNCDNFNKKNIHCSGSSYLPAYISDDEQRIADFYHEHDFFYAAVRSEVIKEDNYHKLIFYIYDKRYDQHINKHIYKQNIKSIILSGNATTREKVILRLFPLAKNRTFDSLSLKKGIANLRESARFSSIEHKLMAANLNSDDFYYSLHLVERSSLILDISFGFSTDQLLVLETELEENNLFSSMLTLKTKLSLGLFFGRQSFINNKFIWPFIWGKPFTFTLHAPIIIYDDKSHRAKPFRRLQSKIVAGLDWRASIHLLPYIKFSLIHTKEDHNPTKLSWGEKFHTLDGLITTLKKPGILSGMVKPGISFINLDNPFDPRSGIDLNNWLELGSSLSKSSFINIGTQNRFYIPLGPCVLALQASFIRSFSTPQGDNFRHIKNISALDKLGGDRSVRGYAEGSIGIEQSKKALSRFSGYISNVANLELRFPLAKKESALSNLWGALFVDQGLLLPCESLFQCGSGLSFEKVVKNHGFGLSVGAGLRYRLPVGPLSLDYGISPLPSHLNSRIHFQFGYPF
jgi:outer membrane protein assembly factor BamA